MDNHDEHTSLSTLQPMVIIFGLILVLTVVASLIFAKPAGEEPVPVVANVEANIKPVAVVEVAAVEAAPGVAKSGEEVYKAVCTMCHAAGLLNAPKFGDKDAWKPRIAQGYETLVTHAINGIRSMPAKGGNPALSDAEIYNSVAYMADAAGAKFIPPAPKDGVATVPVVAAAPAAVAEVAKPEATKTDKKVTSTKVEVTAKPTLAAEPASPMASSAPAVVAEAPAAGKSGEEVYKSVCMLCHAAGLMAAPKFGDMDSWAPRIAQGYDTLVNHAVHGIRNMPAKGGNPGLSDAEVADAVKYMANSSGAKF